jgi:hypothetical protein
VPIFHDAVDLQDHDAFLAWIDAHGDGYYLNRRTPREVMLHQGRCSHAEFTVPVRMTAARKVCSVDAERLRRWAADLGLKLVECSDCLRATSPDGAV